MLILYLYLYLYSHYYLYSHLYFRATTILSAQEYPTIYKVDQIYGGIIGYLECNPSYSNTTMKDKLQGYWDKAPDETWLATILHPNCRIDQHDPDHKAKLILPLDLLVKLIRIHPFQLQKPTIQKKIIGRNFNNWLRYHHHRSPSHQKPRRLIGKLH